MAPHSWFDEGHGDYYAGARSTGDKFRITPFSWRIGTVKAAIRAGPRARGPDGAWDPKSRGYTPLKELVGFSQEEYYAYSSISYAQGWSLIYFLREIVPKNPAWNAKWGKILETYFSVLKGTAILVSTGPASAPPSPTVPTPPPAPAPKPVAPGPAPATPAPAPSTPETPAPAPPAPSTDPSVPAPAHPWPDGGPGMFGPIPNPDPDDDGGSGATPAPATDPGQPPAGDGIAPPRPRPTQGGGDLTRALEEAFRGIDWKAFEDAWKASILKVGG